MYNSNTVSKSFEKALETVIIKKTDLKQFEVAWVNGLSNKTRFYEEFFMKVAKEMGYSITYEKMRCDSSIVDKENIPLVLIETENAHKTASLEIEQLCCLLAPLKVLLISCEWHNSEREIWLPKWQEIFKKYNSAFLTDCKLSIVVAEWGRGVPSDNILRFYIVTLSQNGEVYSTKEIIKI